MVRASLQVAMTADTIFDVFVFFVLPIAVTLVVVVWIHREDRRKGTQTTFCWCPGCGNELCSDPKTNCYDSGSFVNYICGKCGMQSKWDFDTPVPALLESIPK